MTQRSLIAILDIAGGSGILAKYLGAGSSIVRRRTDNHLVPVCDI